jgi:hypothetical protein
MDMVPSPEWEIMSLDKDINPMYECEFCEELFTEVIDWDVQLCPTCYAKECGKA